MILPLRQNPADWMLYGKLAGGEEIGLALLEDYHLTHLTLEFLICIGMAQDECNGHVVVFWDSARWQITVMRPLNDSLMEGPEGIYFEI